MLSASAPASQEMLAADQARAAAPREVDIDDLMDDPELERLHAERLASLQREAEKRAVLQRKGHGELQEVRPGCLVCTFLNMQNAWRCCSGRAWRCGGHWLLVPTVPAERGTHGETCDILCKHTSSA